MNAVRRGLLGLMGTLLVSGASEAGDRKAKRSSVKPRHVLCFLGGAHALAPGPVVVANVGTALTIDAVSASGLHRGGAIVPGPATMVTSLLSGTHGIRRRANGGRAKSSSLFASDTASALAAGSMFAAAAFIDRAVLEAQRELKGRPRLLLTGGGAPALQRYLKSPARFVPDLVLRGLAEFAKP